MGEVVVRIRKCGSLETLARKLLEQTDHPDNVQTCPECGGEIHFLFEMITKRGKRLGAFQIWCIDCKIAMAMDGLESIPKWAKDR